MRRRASRHEARTRAAWRALLGALLLLAGECVAADTAPRPEVARGKLLVASASLADPNFRETVILLLEYAPEGALGVVVNHPTDVALARLLPEVAELQDRKETVYLGGPVARDRMILLVRAATPPAQSARVIDGVYITTSLDVLRGRPPAQGGPAARAYVGYAGWGPGQLDDEIARGDWRVTAADAALLFTDDASALWPRLDERTSGRWVRAPGPSPLAAQRSSGGVALPPPARNACRASTLAFTS